MKSMEWLESKILSFPANFEGMYITGEQKDVIRELPDQVTKYILRFKSIIEVSLKQGGLD